MSGAPPHRLSSLDFLRGTAALLVAIPHFFIFAEIDVPVFEAISVIGVEIFFVLSGFVLAPQILEIATVRPSLTNLGIFWVRRWMRTIPAYLLALSILSIVSHELFTADYFRYALYIQNLFKQANANDYFSIAWSLSVEEWFYLAFPPVILVAASVRRSRTSVLVGALLFIASVTFARTAFGDYSQWGSEVRRVVAFRVDSIAWGFLLYLAINTKPNFLQILGPGSIGAGLAIVSTAGFFLTLSIEDGDASWQKQAFPFVATAIGAIGIILAMKLNAVFEGIPALRVAGLYLGRISYSIYLFHLLVLMTLSGRLAALSWPIQLAAFIAITVLIATLVYEAIEAPILRSRPKFRA
jgi:peptidoglycan/LPS O-acetylase OafA/YrhL